MMNKFRFFLIILIHFVISLKLIKTNNNTVKRFVDNDDDDNDDEMNFLSEVLHKESYSNLIHLRQIRQAYVQNPIYVSNASESSSTLSTTILEIKSSSRVTTTETYIITDIIKAEERGRSPYNPDSCEYKNLTKLTNNTCVQKYDGQMIAANILNNKSKNGTEIAYALSLYISSLTNPEARPNRTNLVLVETMQNIMKNLSNLNLTVNSNTSFLMVQRLEMNSDTMILGASFTNGVGGQLIDASNKENQTHSNISAAAIINTKSLKGVISMNMLIINEPIAYEHITDDSTSKILASSVIIATITRNSSYNQEPMTISLYFKTLDKYKRNGTGKYSCSFYDEYNSQWNESGCTTGTYDEEYYRYECSCNHLTSFALIWLPESLSTGNTTKTFDAQDYATLVFLCISIICFIAIIIHALCTRITNSSINIRAINLLPLISTASTTILFIFYIALGMTVYTQTTSDNETKCFLSSSVLMFIVYFLLIFMFCVKTSVGYFYYLRFVRLFPQPSYRKLSIMLLISFSLALLCVLLAIGFNSNPSFSITRLYPYSLCWFTRDVIYYFMTIPIGTFLLFNIITIILVTKSIIHYARNATTTKQMNERLKRCVIVLLSSCVTQGIGWLLGPFISFVSLSAGNVLSWFFIVLNGLEGVWSIILYILIRSQQIDQERSISTAIELLKSNEFISSKTKKLTKNEECNETDVQTIQKTIKEEPPYSFNNLRKRESRDFLTDDHTNKISS